jgi:hypothetical protein
VIVNEWSYTDADIAVYYEPMFGVDGPMKVTECRTQFVTTTGEDEAAVPDDQLRQPLVVGMKPTEVADKIDRPAAGSSTEPGVVFTVHPQPGIEIG